MTRPQPASGNILFMLLIAIMLIGALTFAITKSDKGGGTLDHEQNEIRAAKVVGLAVDLKRAVENMTRAGKSETTISFAQANLANYGTPDTTPANEVFNINGGGVAWVDVPENINDGSKWEFYGFATAPNVGDPAVPDLMLVLPNVTQAFCTAYNTKAGFPASAAIPDESAACPSDTSKRFSGSFASGGAIVTQDTSKFPSATNAYPAACVKCGTSYNAYYVLLER